MKIWIVYEFDDRAYYNVYNGTFKAFDSYNKMYQYLSTSIDRLVPTEKERAELCDIWDNIRDWETYKKVSIEDNDISGVRWQELEVE